MNPHSDLNHRPDPLLTELEACEFLRIRPRQLYTWRRQGLIPFIRISRSVRYRLSELEAALDAMSVRGSAQGSSARVLDQPQAPNGSQA